MGNESGKHELRCQKTGESITVDIYCSNDEWQFYSERLGFSQLYNSSDVALAYAQKLHNARRVDWVRYS